MRVRKLAVNVFERTAPSLRLPSVNPKGLKTFTLSFTVSVYAAGGLQRQGGWKQAVTNGAEKRSAGCPAIVLSGSPYPAVKDHGGQRLRAIHYALTGPFRVAGSLLQARLTRNVTREEHVQLTDRLAVPEAQCAGGCAPEACPKRRTGGSRRSPLIRRTRSAFEWPSSG